MDIAQLGNDLTFFGLEIGESVEDASVGLEVDGGVYGVETVGVCDEVVDVDEECVEEGSEWLLGEEETMG